MKGTLRKAGKLGILFAALIVCVVVCIKLYNSIIEKNMLGTGLYFIEGKGYLAYGDDEDIRFSLLMYYYNGTGQEDMEVIAKYHDFRLVTDTGEEVPISVSEEKLLSFDYQDDEVIKQNDIDISLQKMNIGEKTVFTKLRYINEKNKQIDCEIGNITIECVDTYSGNISVLAEKIDWRKFEPPAISKYEIFVDNGEDKEINIKEIDFGQTGVKAEIVKNNIVSGEKKEIAYDVETIDDNDRYCIYYLKPIIYLEQGLDIITIVSDDISRQRYVKAENTLYDYFNE